MDQLDAIAEGRQAVGRCVEGLAVAVEAEEPPVGVGLPEQGFCMPSEAHGPVDVDPLRSRGEQRETLGDQDRFVERIRTHVALGPASRSRPTWEGSRRARAPSRWSRVGSIR